MNLNHIFKLRLAVGRFGEMDRAGWWNTKGLLSSKGKTVLERGFPKTHFFAQARIVFAVARKRCESVFSAPNSITLWSLPAEIEDEFSTKWQTWLDSRDEWAPFFERVAASNHDSLQNLLTELSLATNDQIQTMMNLNRSAQGKAVKIPIDGDLDDDALTLLAAGFVRGEKGSLTVPYANGYAPRAQ